VRVLILDIDYTLNMDDPMPLVEIAEKRGLAKYGKAIWKMFEAPAKDMEVLPHPIPYKHYSEFTESYDKIIIITSRLEDWKKPTKQWLKKWGFTYDHMYMRPSGDFKTKSHELKESIMAKIVARFNPTHVTTIDDDSGVIGFYQSQNYKVFKAPDQWYEALKYHRRVNGNLKRKQSKNSTTELKVAK